ncbi:Hypothetical predicted protein [Paramuricea clavata]|uniref:Uncharacterized protein n=1 Tax=Paramuricea clavata TaxID=317549 RepID=A0A6S7GD36_PARCT|nr:Hypothetical predicted protein [Paramuricea clavata]
MHKREDLTSVKVDGLEYYVVPCPNQLEITDSVTGSNVFCSTPLDNETSLSIEDRRFLEVMEKQIHKNSTGHWEMPLPFCQGDTVLPNNHPQAIHHLNGLLKTLKRKPQMEKDYLEFMKTMFSKGHAMPVPSKEIHGQRGHVCYLQHFGVYPPRNQPKERVGVMCDLEQMFYSFYVNPEHWNYLRFLWYKDNDPQKQVIEYRMNVHLFGNRPSPAVATFGLRKTAVRERRNVMETLSIDDRAKGLRDLDLCLDTFPVKRSLGVYWDLENDAFTYQVSLPKKPFTHRGVLSVINSVYDPFGVAAPAMLQG